MNNKDKGFTLTEVLATLVILGILIAIAIPSVSKLQEKFKKDYYKELEGTVLASAKTYFKDNIESRPVNILDAAVVDYSELKNKKYIDEIKGYNSDLVTGRVVIVKLKDDYLYKNCYLINDVEQYGVIEHGENSKDNICHFDDEDSLNTEFSSDLNSNTIYIHVNNYSNDELREMLGVTKKVVRKNKQNDSLYTVDLDETIYPQNITALGISEADDDTEIILKYPISTGGTIDKKAIMFQHPAPVVDGTSGGEVFIKKGNNITVSINNDTFDSDHKSDFLKYQYSMDNGSSWENLCSGNMNYSVNPFIFRGKEVKFRVIGSSSDGKEQIGKESDNYIIKVKTVKVTLNPNGGSVTPLQLTVEYGGNYTDLPTPTRNGYEFLNWQYEDSVIKNGDSVEIGVDHTLVAIWENSTYLIHYNSNGGLGTMSDTTCNSNSNCTLSANTFTKTGYSFAGWSSNSNGDLEHSDKDSVNFGIEKTLYALWNANSYTVTLNPNGGTLSGSNTFSVYYEGEYGEFPTPTRTGYKFEGWYTSSSGGEKIGPAIKYKRTGNQTLYAHWTANNYNVTYNPNGGSVFPNSKTVTYNSEYGTLATPTKTGYTFNGWYTSSTGGEKVTSSTTVTKAYNHYLYAHWTIKNYTVTFNPNGGSVSPTTKTVNYNYSYGDLPVPVRNGYSNGYSFDGWYTSLIGGTKVSSSTKVSSASNHTLYAHWTEIPKKEPVVAPAVNGGSYQVLESGNSIFAGGYVYFSLMVLDEDATVNSVSISYDGGTHYNTCNTIETPGNRSARFDESFASYKEYTRYYCGYNSFTTNATNNIKYKVYYNNSSNTKEVTFALKTVTDKCPSISASGTKGNNNWYKSTVTVNINLESNDAIVSTDWYTNNTSSNYTKTYDGVYYKYWGTSTTNSSPTLSSSTLSGFGTRRYLIETKDLIGSVGQCTGSYKIDAEAPTMSIIMKKMGTVAATDANYKTFTSKPNYTSGAYDRNILFYINSVSDADSSKSGVKSYSCTPSGADENRNASNFSTFRNIVSYGTTNISCTIVDNAGNSKTYTKTITNKHDHDFGNSFGTARAIFSNYLIQNYDNKWGNSGTWKCTAGHIHTYDITKKAAFIRCIYCGQTSVDLGLRSIKGAWWCPSAARDEGYKEVYG